MEVFIAVIGLAGAIAGGIIQAYPGVVPGGDFYVGWSAIIISLASFSYILLIRLRRFIGVRRLKNEVLRRCSKDMPIQITVMMGSAKGSAFAEELSSFLREHGYQVQVFPGIFQDSNFRGISHHAQEGKNMIGVGHIPF